jgi:catechol 2,3-dioxygenase-like lactoylglutathione lyase family enzyme
MIKGIKFASIPVSDQDRALEFYTQSLGFRVITDQPFDESQRWIELGLPANGASLVLFTPDEHRERIGTYQHVTFYTDDVRGTWEELRRRGVEFVQEPQEADWGTAAVFKDPDGNVFVLSSR